MAEARKFGIDPAKLDYRGRASTAHGEIRTARARIASLQIGPFDLRDVEISVGDTDMGGVGLIGMSFLKRYKVTVSDNTLTVSE